MVRIRNDQTEERSRVSHLVQEHEQLVSIIDNNGHQTVFFLAHHNFVSNPNLNGTMFTTSAKNANELENAKKIDFCIFRNLLSKTSRGLRTFGHNLLSGRS